MTTTNSLSQREQLAIQCLEFLENLPEYAPGDYLYCIGWKYAECRFRFKAQTIESANEGTYVYNEITVERDQFLKGMHQLLDWADENPMCEIGRWVRSGDLGQWDSDVMNLLLNFTIYGELVFG